MQQLSWPTLLCHRLRVSDDGRILDYVLRQQDPKRQAVEAFKGLNYRIFAAGDSYNDITMLGSADSGFLFKAPDNVKAAFPQFKSTDDYSLLRAMIDEAARAA